MTDAQSRSAGPPQPPELALYDWSPSPFCLKVRALLEHKRLAYRRLPVLGAGIFELRRRGGNGKVPALLIGSGSDARLVTDSTDIAHAVEALAPDPAVLPADARARALCHALEDWCDEALYFVGLYHQWLDEEGAPMVPQAFGSSLAGRAAYRWYRRLIARQLRGQGIARKSPAQIAADLEREAEAIAALLQRAPFLLGETPLLCDFALFGQLVYWTRPPKTARAIARHPAIGDYLARMKALRAPAAPAAVPG